MAFLKWFDGKKTTIAALYWAVVPQVIMVWFPDGAPEPAPKVIATVGIVLTAIGLGHKALKAKGEKE